MTEKGNDVDIVSWWRDRSKEFPHLSKMARQYLALPCSSAGMAHGSVLHSDSSPNNSPEKHIIEVTHEILTFYSIYVGPERLFSVAGRMHDDLKKSTLESSLKHRLIIHQNT